MKEQVREIYLANNHQPAAFDSYFDSLNNYKDIQIHNELKKRLINEPAPDFALKNLEGEEVSLASLKGQTIVLDFWSTGCHSCIEAFPSMKRAMAKLQEKNIPASFLYVDVGVFEKTERVQKLKDFMKKRDLPFNVLLDEKGNSEYGVKMRDAYNVVGIPTKIIIDSRGTIRFKILGDINEDWTVRQMPLMIKMAEEMN